MPIGKKCKNSEWFYGSAIAKLRALVKVDNDTTIVENKGTIIALRLGPIQADTCGYCNSRELAWPFVEIPFKEVADERKPTHR